MDDISQYLSHVVQLGSFDVVSLEPAEGLGMAAEGVEREFLAMLELLIVALFFHLTMNLVQCTQDISK